MIPKNIEKIFAPPPVHFVGDGFRVHNFISSLPGLDMRRMDPFILLDYNAPHYFPPTDRPRGVSVHPHKGFETVTIAYKGRIAHHDSSGGGGIIHEGEVQWMTAGAGLLHKEYHESSFSAAGGYFHMAQLWVNLPAKHKPTHPKYQHISRDSIVKVNLPGQGHALLIAGEYLGHRGPANTFSPVLFMNVVLSNGEKTQLSLNEGYSSALVVVEGNIVVNNQAVGTNHFVLLEREGETIDLRAGTDAVVLVMSGKPLNEPIAAQGPFVMNTRAELIEAYQEFQSGKFGYLEE
ncbi:MAG TPA: pirin family protein [Bacteroidales bacterium]|nr:pirin family protein [Bacteroidales bacterium]